MKKYNLIVIILGITGIMLYSSACNKEETNSPANGNADNGVALKQTSWGICCVWNGVDACVSPSVNCFDEVVIHGYAREAYNNLVDAANGRASDVSNYFRGDQWPLVFRDLDADEGKNAANIDYLHKLQSGDYDLIIVSEGDYTKFLAGRGDVTPDNAEFVLQVSTKEL